jgi:flavin reductase (DIM6/NTAB) family NADH-FMN oxidoreductase RutF
MFSDIAINELRETPFELFGDRWTLITPSSEVINPMTASWGGLGVIWNRNIVFITIRPVRYTYELIEKTNNFTLTFFDEKYRDILNFCGTKSGRKVDKIKETGLTPIKEDGYIYYKEATYAIFCNKLYFTDIDPKNFIEKDIELLYPKKDYHRMYIGEIVKVKRK